MSAAIDLVGTDDDRAIRSATARFLADTAPVAELRRLADEPTGMAPGWWVRTAELGWMAMAAEHSAGIRYLALVALERGGALAPGPFAAAAAAVRFLASCPQAALQRLAAEAEAGTVIVLWGAEAGADPARPSTVRARAAGERWVLDGTTASIDGTGVTGASAAAGDGPAPGAVQVVVPVITGEGPALAVVPTDAAGVTVIDQWNLDLVGRRALLRFEGVEIAGDQVVGPRPPGLDQPGPDPVAATELVTVLRGWEAYGAALAAHRATVDYLFERYSFGRPLASYQALKHRVADQVAALHQVAALLSEAVARWDDGPQARSLAVATAAAVATEVLPEVVQDCIQLHGGIGITWEHDLHLHLRRVLAATAASGTAWAHRERIAALLLDGPPADGAPPGGASEPSTPTTAEEVRP